MFCLYEISDEELLVPQGRFLPLSKLELKQIGSIHLLSVYLSGYWWNAIHLLSLHIQVVMKRHSSLGSVGCDDCGIYGEN